MNNTKTSTFLMIVFVVLIGVLLYLLFGRRMIEGEGFFFLRKKKNKPKKGDGHMIPNIESDNVADYYKYLKQVDDGYGHMNPVFDKDLLNPSYELVTPGSPESYSQFSSYYYTMRPSSNQNQKKKEKQKGFNFWERKKKVKPVGITLEDFTKDVKIHSSKTLQKKFEKNPFMTGVYRSGEVVPPTIFQNKPQLPQNKPQLPQLTKDVAQTRTLQRRKASEQYEEFGLEEIPTETLRKETYTKPGSPKTIYKKPDYVYIGDQNRPSNIIYGKSTSVPTNRNPEITLYSVTP